jgi:Domain of unknown function (DUF222)
MAGSACTPHGPSPYPEGRRGHPAVVPVEPSAADERPGWDEADWDDSYVEDDPSEGARDRLSAEEISWLYDVEEEPDGPDPDLCPDAYPELGTPVKWPNGDRARAFVSVLRPGSMLAGLLEDCVPDRMEDGALAESLPAWRRIASWAAAGELAAIAELSRRRVPQLWDHRDEPDEAVGISAEAVMVSREAIEEVALALTLTHWAADVQAHLAVSLTRRLPATLAALSAGRIDLPRARLVEEATAPLDDEDAQRAEARILPRAGGMTTGELREALRRAVISIDPAAAEKRRKRAERNARVRLYGDADHTATLTGEKLPAASAAAAYARIAAIAAAMKAAGMPGNTELLQSQVFTGLLLGTLPRIPQPRPRPGDAGPGDAGPSDTEGPQGPADPGHTGGPSGFSLSGSGDAGAPGGPADPSHTGNPPHSADPGGTSGPSHSAGSGPTGPGGTGRGHQGPPGDGGASDSSSTGPVRCDHATQVTDHTGPEPARTDRWTRNPPEGSGRAGSPPSWPMLPTPGGAAAPGCADIPAGLGPPAGKLRLAVPWRTLMGLAPEPGRLCWVGPVTPQTAREIAAVAAADPTCTWSVIITDDEGRAIAVTRVRRRRMSPAHSARPGGPGPARPGGPGPPGLVRAVTVTLPYSLIGTFSIDVRERALLVMQGTAMSGVTGAECLGDVLATAVKAAAAKIAAEPPVSGTRSPTVVSTDAWAAPETCSHTDAVAGYRVPDSMREFLQARDVTCRSPVCRQPARHCDADHTIPYDKGGRTCRCNLGNTCRSHHQLKQLPGWTLEHPSPGIFTWRTPSGLSCTATPDRHPI